jgi:hypothetical protein
VIISPNDDADDADDDVIDDLPALLDGDDDDKEETAMERLRGGDVARMKMTYSLQMIPQINKRRRRYDTF